MFVLIPIVDSVLALVLEYEQIYRSWESAFHRGEVTEESYPGKSTYFVNLKKDIEAKIDKPHPLFQRTRGIVINLSGQESKPAGVLRDQEVCWQKVA